MNQARDPVLFRNPGPTPTPIPSRAPLMHLSSPAVQRIGHRTDLPRIDHRQARRLAVQIPLLLRFCHDQCAFGIARNLSRDGIFVETTASPEGNVCLDLMVPGLALADAAPARFPVLLVHRTDQGLGLLFRSLEGRTAAALERLLEEAQSAYLQSRTWGAGTAI
jgi:hypothetical protein